MMTLPGGGGSEGSGRLPTSSAPDSQEGTFGYSPGDLIADKYLLVRTLDHGGMGVVWVAHHLGLDVHVALKLIRPEARTRDSAERLLREAQTAARLDHPAIVHVLDVGRTAEGHPFLVMELLEGESLSDVLFRETKLDPVTAIRLILPIAGALEALHAKGIVHRDVKPSNIFLAVDDAGRWQPKLIDFGLARLAEERSVRRLTERGAIVGTPDYLSPERVRGQDAHPRDDVWALCVALYEMTTGKSPFPGNHMLDLFVSIAGAQPTPLAAHGVSDPGLWEILRRGLTTGADRWSSMLDLREALSHELLRRGATKDISGVALNTVLGLPVPPAIEVDAPAAPSRSPLPGAPAGRSSRPGAETASMVIVRVPSVVPPPAALAQPSAPDARGAASRPKPVIALGLVMLGVVLGLFAGVLIGRQSKVCPGDRPAVESLAR